MRHNTNHHHQDHDEVLSSKEISSRFHIEKILGRGAFATVYKAIKRAPGDTRINKLGHCYNDNHQEISQCDFNTQCGNKQCQKGGGGESNRKQDVSLKIVDVSKVVKRRIGTKNNINTQDERVCDDAEKETKILSSEYDTEELFFPSRFEKKKQMHLKRGNGDNRYADDEYNATIKLLRREISVHLNISRQKHPNIVTMFESFQYNVVGNGRVGKDPIIVMVMEYCPFGDLQHYLKRKRDERKEEMIVKQEDYHEDQDSHMISTLLDMKEIQYAMRHILRGLAFLHSRGIVHRDIKAGNILLSKAPLPKYSDGQHLNGQKTERNQNSFTLFDCCLKISDFGLAVQMEDEDDWNEAQHTFCGTPSCLAPEVALSKKEPTEDLNNLTLQMNQDIRGHGQPADLWSLGCLFYVMLVGRHPFSRAVHNQNMIQKGPPDKLMKMRETIQRVLRGDWRLPHNLCVSEAAFELLSQLLSMNPQKRGFARVLLSTHSFFNQIKSDEQDKEILLSKPSSLHSLSEIKEEDQDNHDSPIGCKSSELSFHPRGDCHIKRTEKVDVVTSDSVISSKMNVIKTNIHERSENSIQVEKMRRKIKSSSLKTFINTIKNIHQLPPMKHRWESKKYNKSGSLQTMKLSFTIFILPETKGIVFQCEQADGRGAWMHITGDGENICLGKLTKSSMPVSICGNIDPKGDTFLLFEAFSRSPKKLKRFRDSTFDAVTNNENQSLCTMGPLHNTMYSTPSIHSAPPPSHRHFEKTKYKKLSCLLQRKNRPFLSLFRKLDKFVKELSKNVPKIHLAIHECREENLNCGQVGSLLCTVALVENVKSFILVTYADGFHIKYDRSTGFAEIHLIDSNGNYSRDTITVYLQSNNIVLQDQDKGKTLGGAKIELYLSYLQFARSAIKKCVEIEREIQSQVKSNQLLPFPRGEMSERRKLVVKGKSFRSWVDVTHDFKGSDNNQDNKENMAGLLNRSLIDENNVTSLSLLDSNNRKYI